MKKVETTDESNLKSVLGNFAQSYADTNDFIISILFFTFKFLIIFYILRLLLLTLH